MSSDIAWHHFANCLNRRFPCVEWRPFDESLRRHAGKPQASTYGAAEMKAWYRGLDLLPGGTEQVIPAAMTQDEIVRRVMADSGLAAALAQEGL